MKPYSHTPLAVKEKADIRMSHFFQSELSSNTKIALIGFPVDEGVRRNGGIPGARFAPDSIRGNFYKMVSPTALDKGIIVDLGNLDVENKSMEECQDALGDVIADLHEKGIVPIILGGGHETAFGHALGYIKAKKRIEIINLDAHTDVRELNDGKGHSGSPFRQALEHESGFIKGYHVIGAQRNRVAEYHAEFVKKHGSIWYRDEEQQQLSLQENLMLTIDLDVFDASFMMGVSAPNSNGFSKQEGLDTILSILKTGKVQSIDIVELNPLRDIQGMSSLFAAHILWEIIHHYSTK